MVIMKFRTAMLHDSLFILIVAICCNTLKSQFLLGKAIWNFALSLQPKTHTVASTKDSHETPKNQISVAATLNKFKRIKLLIFFLTSGFPMSSGGLGDKKLT